MKRRNFVAQIAAIPAMSIRPERQNEDLGDQALKAKASDLEKWELYNATRKVRSALYNDPYRPIYHFVAPEGETHPFDPNGAIFWNGAYHLGYIYQHFDENGKKYHYWGQVKSYDLLHWTYLPPMLILSPDDPEEGIYSGNAFISKEGIPHIAYFGIGVGNCMAKAVDEDLVIWEKFQENPVVISHGRLPKTSITLDNENHAFDPHIWLENDVYYQVSGGNPAALYKSKDLKNWQYVGQFLDQTKRMRYDFEDWACPDVFKLGDKHIAVGLSHNLGAFYYIGEFKNEQFIPDSFERMNWHGGTMFAPETLVDDKNRRILWGWVREYRKKEEDVYWSGIMSLPRVMSLDNQGKMNIAPPEELQRLRYSEISIQQLRLHKEKERVLSIDFARSAEIYLEAKIQGEEEFGVKVFCSSDGKEETVLKYQPKSGQFIIDFSRSSREYPTVSSHWEKHFDQSVPDQVTEQKTAIAPIDGKIIVEIFIDRSVIEVFLNRHKCMTQTLYPSVHSKGIKLFDEGGKVEFQKVSCWKMAKTNFV